MLEDKNGGFRHFKWFVESLFIIRSFLANHEAYYRSLESPSQFSLCILVFCTLGFEFCQVSRKNSISSCYSISNKPGKTLQTISSLAKVDRPNQQHSFHWLGMWCICLQVHQLCIPNLYIALQSRCAQRKWDCLLLVASVNVQARIHMSLFILT